MKVGAFCYDHAMIPKNVYQLLAHYHLWMDQKNYLLCEQIPDDERKQDRGAFFHSIHGTFNHLLLGNLRWMGRFLKKTLTTAEIGETICESFAELKREHLQVDQMIVDWAEGLTEAWLAEEMIYDSGVYQKHWKLPRWIFVTHMFNHQTHHRGQLMTLLTQMGHDPGITDIVCLPQLEAGILADPKAP